MIKDYIAENLTISLSIDEYFGNIRRIRVKTAILLEDELISSDSEYFDIEN
jgi:hypothetical protein